MKRIFEDILDDLDTISGQKSTAQKVADESSMEQFDYILYIGRTLEGHDNEQDQQREMFYFKKDLQRLTDKMDVLLEDYYCDDVLYCEDEEMC